MKINPRSPLMENIRQLCAWRDVSSTVENAKQIASELNTLEAAQFLRALALVYPADPFVGRPRNEFLTREERNVTP